MRKKKEWLKIIYENEQIIVVDKPHGLLTIATQKGSDEDNLYHRVYEHVNKRENRRIFVVHRLDKDTGGLVVFAKDPFTKNRLQKMFEEHKAIRKYEAVVSGVMKKDEDTVTVNLLEDRFGNIFVNKKGKTVATTSYKVVKRLAKSTVIDIELFTGKKNQIRATMDYLGHPIIGDKKYGKKKNKIMLLRSYRLDFPELIMEQNEFSIPKQFDNYIEK